MFAIFLGSEVGVISSALHVKSECVTWLYLDNGVVRIRLIVKNDMMILIPANPIRLDRRHHHRHGLALVHVHDGGRRRGDRGCAIIVRRDSTQRPIIVDSREDKADLVFEVLVV